MSVKLWISFLLAYTSGFCLSLSGEDINFNQVESNKVCKTPGCIKAARIISENMDKTIQPCDNFYQFACGNYIKTAIIQKDKTSASILGQADDRLRNELKIALEATIDESDCRTLQLLKAHYDTCLNVEKIEQTSVDILLDILNKLGGWPIVVGESWDESSFDWKRLIYKLRRLGYQNAMQSFITFNIEVDEKNNTQYVIVLDQANTGLLYDYIVKGMENEIVQAYYMYMLYVAKDLGVSKHTATTELAESLNFEIEIAKISLSPEERRNMSQLYNPMTVAELESEYPGIPWKEYINELLHPFRTIDSNEKVIVGNPKYLKCISKLISKTPKRVLANYAIWQVVQESIPFMSEQYLNDEADFVEHTTGTDKQLPRPDKCINYLNENIPLAVGALYVRKIFNKDFKKQGQKLVEDLYHSFKRSLEKVDWMDGQTKTAALRKLKSIHAHIAYPDELLDNKILDRYYKNLKLVPDSYLESYLSLRLFQIDDTYRQLGKPYNKTEWITHGDVAIVNAFYEFSENSLQLPAGFFQPELFALDRPNYMNYGAIGYFIGHELTHAFDDEGGQYDGEGNLVNWWDPKTQKEYKKRAQCIVNQYSNYTVEQVGLNINGINTQGENIADNGGIKQAYLAYEEYEKRNGPESRLPGLPYSPRQLFWISQANTYCEKHRPEALKFQITADEHSPGEFRVIGTMSNMPEFARDFQCPVGSFMNSAKKCSFW